MIKTFSTNAPFLYQRFSVFREDRSATLVENGLNKLLKCLRVILLSTPVNIGFSSVFM